MKFPERKDVGVVGAFVPSAKLRRKLHAAWCSQERKIMALYEQKVTLGEPGTLMP